MSETIAITGKSVKLFKGHYTSVTASSKADPHPVLVLSTSYPISQRVVRDYAVRCAKPPASSWCALRGVRTRTV
ncbi:MAG: hypothetical protein ACREYE_18075 [Gammaproteobacteria bacterium]